MLSLRLLLSVMLVAILTACPALCGPCERGGLAHGHEAAGGDDGSPDAPAHCPAESDNCICSGAIQADDARLPDQDAPRPLLAMPVLLHTPAHPLPHLTVNGEATGIAAVGSPRAVRSILQNYRC